MPTVAELQRLDALVNRLTPLSQVAQGELIRAQAWNDVVGTVIELARAVLAGAQEDVIPPHDHSEQVALSWLDPRLRSLIERGPLGDPAAIARVADLERKITQANGRFATVDENVREVRNRIAEVATRDLARQTEVGDLQRVVDGIADPRDDITALRETLRAVQADLGTALEVGRRLTIGGQPVDVAGLLDRVAAVEEVRDRLRMPDGSLLDANSLEQRIVELTNTLVTEAELEEAIKNRRPRLNATERAALREQLIADAQSGFNTALDNRAAELRNEIATSLSDLDSRVARAVSDAVPAVRDTVLADARAEFTTALDAAKNQVLADATRGLSDRETLIRADTDAQITAVRGEIAPAVTAGLDRELPARLAPMQEALNGTGARADTLEQRAAALEQGSVLQSQRVDGLETVVKSTTTSLETLSTSLTTIETQLKQSVESLRAELLVEIDRRSRLIAAEDVRAASDQLRLEFNTTIDTRMSAMSTDLTNLVKTAMAEESRRNQELINSRLDALRGEMPVLVEREFTTFQPRLNVLIEDAVRRNQ